MLVQKELHLLIMSNAVLICFTVTGRSSLQLEAWDSVKGTVSCDKSHSES